MSKIKVSIQGHARKYEFDSLGSIEEARKYVQLQLRKGKFLGFEGKNAHTFIPVNTVTMVEISE